MQSLHKEGEVNPLEGLRARHKLQRLGMCPWVAKVQKAGQEVQAVEGGAPTVLLVGALGLGEDVEQELDPSSIL